MTAIAPSISEIQTQVADLYHQLTDTGFDFNGLPDGTSERFHAQADAAVAVSALAHALGQQTFRDLASISFFAVMESEKPAQLREALLAQAALTVRWVEQIDQRNGK